MGPSRQADNDSTASRRAAQQDRSRVSPRHALPRRLFLVAFVGLLVGCASTPHPTNYADALLPENRGEFVDRAWFDTQAIAQEKILGIDLRSIEPYGIADVEGIPAAQAVEWLRGGFAPSRYAGEGLWIGSSKNGVATMDVVLTELDPGNTSTRFWIGAFGGGHAWVQIEARLVSGDDERVIGRFAHRVRKLGAAPIDYARYLDSSPKLVREMLDEIGLLLRKEVESALRPTRRAYRAKQWKQQ